MTLAQAYRKAKKQGWTVVNLFSVNLEIYGCSIKKDDIHAYAQGHDPAQAMERAMETLERLLKR